MRGEVWDGYRFMERSLVVKVAVRGCIFTKEEDADHLRFWYICGMSGSTSKVAITLHEGSTASDQNNKKP
ncbi:hypothetical protein AVEN_167702-1, partial [Araneus ventricosus]